MFYLRVWTCYRAADWQFGHIVLSSHVGWGISWETSFKITGRFTFINLKACKKCCIFYTAPVLAMELRTDCLLLCPSCSFATVCNDISWKHLKFPLPSFYNILRSNFRNDPKEKKGRYDVLPLKIILTVAPTLREIERQFEPVSIITTVAMKIMWPHTFDSVCYLV